MDTRTPAGHPRCLQALVAVPPSSLRSDPPVCNRPAAAATRCHDVTSWCRPVALPATEFHLEALFIVFFSSRQHSFSRHRLVGQDEEAWKESRRVGSWMTPSNCVILRTAAAAAAAGQDDFFFPPLSHLFTATSSNKGRTPIQDSQGLFFLLFLFTTASVRSQSAVTFTINQNRVVGMFYFPLSPEG